MRKQCGIEVWWRIAREIVIFLPFIRSRSKRKESYLSIRS
jgi:hypothetical protein